MVRDAWRDAGAPCYNLKGCKAHVAAEITISDLTNSGPRVVSDPARLERSPAA